MEEERCYKVYLHSLICDKGYPKYYVGITKQKLEKRWKNGDGYKKQFFYNAILKYGWENINHELIADCLTAEESENFEIKLISELHSNDREYGYNIENGGSMNKVSNETKEKLREINLGTNGTSARKVEYNGLIFGCVKDFSNYISTPIGTVYSWLTGNTRMPKKYFEKGLKLVNDKYAYNNVIIAQSRVGGFPKVVVCDGIEFNSLKDFALHYKIDYNVASSWLYGRCCTPKNFIDMGLCYKDGTDKVYSGYKITQHENKSRRKVICDDIIYNTISECAKKYNVNRRTMNLWLLNRDKMPQKFKDLGLKYYNNEED